MQKSRNQGQSKIPKQTAFLSIITIRKKHELIGRFLKIGSTRILLKKFTVSSYREEEALLLNNAPSHPRDSILTADNGNYYTAHVPSSVISMI
jgi:hypothetical protein